MRDRHCGLAVWASRGHSQERAERWQAGKRPEHLLSIGRIHLRGTCAQARLPGTSFDRLLALMAWIGRDGLPCLARKLKESVFMGPGRLYRIKGSSVSFDEKNALFDLPKLLNQIGRWSRLLSGGICIGKVLLLWDSTRNFA